MQVLARSNLSVEQRKSLIEPINSFFDAWVAECGHEYVYSREVLKNNVIKTAFEQMGMGEFNQKALRKFMKVHRHFRYYNFEIRGYTTPAGRGDFWAIKSHWDCREVFK